MKLRTRIVPYASRMSADGEPNDAWHDAMAAHALLQAMGEVAEFPDEMPDEMWELLRNDRGALTQAFRMTVRDTRDEIKQRAAEILAGWLGASTHNSTREGCGCRACNDPTWTNRHFVVCPKCGNKRCPKAENHEYACTGSNDPAQTPQKEQEVE